MFPRKTTPPLRLLVATREPRVLELLDAQFQPYTRVEALTTEQVYHALGQVDGAIVDLADLVESKIARADLVVLWDALPIPRATSDAFIADPAVFRARAVASAGAFAALAPQTVWFTAYSGGVGKTTLALDLATHFAARTQLPTALVEFGYGPSALRAVTGLANGADVFDAATQGKPLQIWQGVTLAPFDFDIAQHIPGATARALLDRVRARHILTVIDAGTPYPFADTLDLARAAQTFIVASPRPDAWANAERLAQKIEAARIVFNLVDKVSDKLAQVGLERALDLPRLAAMPPNGALAKKLLPLVYPGWREK